MCKLQCAQREDREVELISVWNGSPRLFFSKRECFYDEKKKKEYERSTSSDSFFMQLYVYCHHIPCA